MDYFNNYTKKCKDTLGGIKKVYLLPYVEYNETKIQSSGMSLTMFPSSYVYEFDVSGSFTQNSQLDKGNASFNPTVTIEMSKVYTFQDMNAFVRNDFRIIALTENDNLIMFGTNNGMICDISNSSGNDKGEFNGFTITFEGMEENTGLLIDNFDDFFYLFDGQGVFNYAFNFDII